MGRQSRILRLFRAAGDEGGEKRKPSIFLIILIMTLVAAAVGYIAFGVYHHLTSRPFIVKISPIPIPASEVLVLVTDIEFEGEG